MSTSRWFFSLIIFRLNEYANSIFLSTVDWLGCLFLHSFFIQLIWALHEVSSSPSVAGGAQLTVPGLTTALNFAELLLPSMFFLFLASTTGSLFSFRNSFVHTLNVNGGENMSECDTIWQIVRNKIAVYISINYHWFSVQ